MDVRIDTVQLGNDIAALRSNIEDLKRARSKIYQSLETLQSMWEGPAQKTFYMQTALDNVMLSGLLSNINHLIECMEYAKSRYERCSDDINSKIAGIRISGDT